MSDAEKPFDPTPQRIAKAKREGNVARSGELGANAAFAAAIVATAGVAPAIAACARVAIVQAAAGSAPVAACVAIAAWAAVPAAAAAAGGVVAGVAQAGGANLAAVTANLRRLDPFEGIKRLCSRETAAHSLRGAIAFALAAGCMLPALAAGAAQLLRAHDLAASSAAVWHAAQRVAFAACAVGGVFAIAEYAAARRAWLRKLRMSLDERKREMKEQEGDPVARGRRRALARSILRGSLRDVERAAFVVANPTHVAVALEYRPPEIPVPRVAVRAAEAAALRVRAIAAAAGIPIVENVALARALFAGSRAGEAIPYALYVGVAEIVAALTRSGALRP